MLRQALVLHAGVTDDLLPCDRTHLSEVWEACPRLVPPFNLLAPARASPHPSWDSHVRHGELRPDTDLDRCLRAEGEGTARSCGPEAVLGLGALPWFEW